MGDTEAGGTATGKLGRTLTAPMAATVCEVLVGPGEVVAGGSPLVVLESMKTEHAVVSDEAKTVTALHVTAGQAVVAGDPLVTLGPPPAGGGKAGPTQVGASGNRAGDAAASGGGQRADLAEVLARHAATGDAARPGEIARRHGTGKRSAREDIADLLDPGSFVEYGPLVVAAQRRRRDLDELIRRTPADGLVGGLGRIGGRPVVVASYDYTVLAGTQGYMGHRKKDRLFELAAAHKLPVVVFAEGGGGRPGDTDSTTISGLDCMAFRLFAQLSGRVPLVGIANGRCFAGNAALLACCDVVIATEGSNIGMGGPAMIEGGGLGVFAPEEFGPLTVQVANGVVDLAVADQAEAVATARRYLSYFSPGPAEWTCAEQRILRDLVPEARRRSYDVRHLLSVLADDASVLELRAGHAPGLVSALARVEGHALGVLANDPAVDGGAVTGEVADKASRFMQLCDAHRLPLLSLVDTPGFMVGPDAEAGGLVAKAGRMFVAGARMKVPTMTIIVRRAYGLGAQAMAGGSLKAPVFSVGWPTSELGGMGIEGAVRLAQRRELEAIPDPDEREARFAELVAHQYELGRGLSVASVFEIDDVIDPAESRRWISAALATAGPGSGREAGTFLEPS